MQRRKFLHLAGAAGSLALAPALARAAASHRYDRLLVLIELKGGNDGLNTLVPYADPRYADLRPRIGIKREEVVQLDEAVGLHPALGPLLPLWKSGELALIQGVGYPHPNLSHFRSIEIWDTASAAEEVRHDGWLTRAFAAHRPSREFAADGIVIGSPEFGPLAGIGARSIALDNVDQFVRQARLANPAGTGTASALRHILQVESDVAGAARRLGRQHALRTEFPAGAFGKQVRTACQVAAGDAGVAALRLSLNGFDTHQNQPGTHANLLRQLAEGLVALRSALSEVGRWDRTLVLTYAEFGRRPRENQSNGTDHGTTNVHFALGGRVRGGLYGAAPALQRLDGNGNPPFAVDFRAVYASVLERWWGSPSPAVLGGHFPPLDFIRA